MMLIIHVSNSNKHIASTNNEIHRRKCFTKKVDTERLNQLAKPRYKKEERNSQASQSIIDTEFDIGISKEIYNVDEK